jgi:hypothetical protein
MNYIAAHGFVMLYPKLTLKNLGMVNSGGNVTGKLEGCINKYVERGFTLTRGYPSAVPKSHACGVDKHCPQTIRHLQDDEVMHIPFPAYSHVESGQVRREFDAYKCVWQLANGPYCRKETADRNGFSLVNNYASRELHILPPTSSAPTNEDHSQDQGNVTEQVLVTNCIGV